MLRLSLMGWELAAIFQCTYLAGPPSQPFLGIKRKLYELAGSKHAAQGQIIYRMG